MPTTVEFQALGAAVNTTWTQVNNVYGILCTDKTDSSKTLFFPTVGFCTNNRIVGVNNYGGCWSSSLDTNNRNRAYGLYLYGGTIEWDPNYNRCFGYTVRPVVG